MAVSCLSVSLPFPAIESYSRPFMIVSFLSLAKGSCMKILYSPSNPTKCNPSESNMKAGLGVLISSLLVGNNVSCIWNVDSLGISLQYCCPSSWLINPVASRPDIADADIRRRRSSPPTAARAKSTSVAILLHGCGYLGDDYSDTTGISSCRHPGNGLKGTGPTRLGGFSQCMRASWKKSSLSPNEALGCSCS